MTVLLLGLVPEYNVMVFTSGLGVRLVGISKFCSGIVPGDDS